MSIHIKKGHEGRFTAKANKAGVSVAEFAKEKSHAGGTLGKEAVFAENAKHWNHKHTHGMIGAGHPKEHTSKHH
jgi:hypothetical protein